CWLLACWVVAEVVNYQVGLRQVKRLAGEKKVDFRAAGLELGNPTRKKEQGLGAGGQVVGRRRLGHGGLAPFKGRNGLGFFPESGKQPLRQPRPPPGLIDQPPGFSSLVANGQRWRVLRLISGEGKIWIYENLADRRGATNLLLLGSLFPLGLALPVLAALIWFGVTRGLAPLRQLASQVKQRSAQRLEPLPLTRVPQEAAVLVAEINALLQRLDGALEAERRLTSDAAHEIRTPLASLLTHTQVALRSSDPQAHARGLVQVRRSAERISQLMEQILLLARLDSGALQEQFVTVHLGGLAADTLSELAPLAIDKNIDLVLEDQDVQLSGIPTWLGVLLTNLVGNAIRYTPSGGQVLVRVAAGAPGRVRMDICDSGPGVSAEERERIFTRFYRSESAGQNTGSGLGLPIVKRIVEIHGGSLYLGEGLQGRGLGVHIELPGIA
ncbi:ATPase, partial [Pseudomonas oryzihabitans]